MLILTRRLNEGVTLTTEQGEIKLIVLENKRGGGVRLGFDAPEGVNIARDELVYRAKKLERKES